MMAEKFEKERVPLMQTDARCRELAEKYGFAGCTNHTVVLMPQVKHPVVERMLKLGNPRLLEMSNELSTKAERLLFDILDELDRNGGNLSQ